MHHRKKEVFIFSHVSRALKKPVYGNLTVNGGTCSSSTDSNSTARINMEEQGACKGQEPDQGHGGTVQDSEGHDGIPPGGRGLALNTLSNDVK